MNCIDSYLALMEKMGRGLTPDEMTIFIAGFNDGYEDAKLFYKSLYGKEGVVNGQR